MILYSCFVISSDNMVIHLRFRIHRKSVEFLNKQNVFFYENLFIFLNIFKVLFHTWVRKILIQKTYKIFNVAVLELVSPGNRPGALTTKPYVLIKLRRNFYTLVSTYLCCQHFIENRQLKFKDINKNLFVLYIAGGTAGAFYNPKQLQSLPRYNI